MKAKSHLYWRRVAPRVALHLSLQKMPSKGLLSDSSGEGSEWNSGPSESGIFTLADPENGVHLSEASSVQDKTGELLAHVLNSRESSCLGRRLKTLYESPLRKWVWVLPSVALDSAVSCWARLAGSWLEIKVHYRELPPLPLPLVSAPPRALTHTNLF